MFYYWNLNCGNCDCKEKFTAGNSKTDWLKDDERNSVLGKNLELEPVNVAQELGEKLF